MRVTSSLVKVPTLFGVAVLLVGLVASCREEVSEVEVGLPPLWELLAGEEWHYDVTASYLPDASPKRWCSDDKFYKRDGRAFLKFRRTKVYRGKKEIREGKGAWDVMEHRRGGKLEECEYFEITPERVSFWGSKIEGDSPKRAVCLSTPMDLVKKGISGGEIWQYALGSDEKGGYDLSFGANPSCD
jgi:hypothetical protein